MIKDHTHVEKVIQQFNKYSPKLKSLILSKGGTVNEEAWVNIGEAYERVLRLKNRFTEEYYAATDLKDIYSKLDEDSFKRFSPEVQSNYNSLKSYMNRVSASYDFNIMNRLSVQLDPVSALFLIIDVSLRRDAEVYDSTTCTQEWLDHNFNYLAKVGFSSGYFYPLLKKTVDGYGRFEDIILDDDQLEDMATAAVVQQSTLLGVTLEEWPLSDVQVKALENNNASAESFPGYGNLRNDEVKERVIGRSQVIKDEGTIDDVFPFSQLHRIQSGGNVIFNYLTLTKNEETGNYEYSKDQLVSVISQIASERGYSVTYVEKEPQVLPELITLIGYTQLPESYAIREQLVNAGDYPPIIMNTFKNTDVWMFNYEVEFPNVFTLIGDKYESEFEELSSKIYTKHRSVKASGPDFSRIVQSYLYPLMKHLSSLRDSKFSSFVSQWEHPDYIKRMLTNMMVMINPELYENVVDYDLDIQAAIDFKEKIMSQYSILLSADDKTGFDQFFQIINLWLFFTTYFSIPFAKNEQNNRLMKMMCQQFMFPVLLTPDGIEIFDTIIPSGGGLTSAIGTYGSNHAGLTVQGSLLRIVEKANDEEESNTDEVDEYNSPEPDDIDDDEGGSANG